MNRQLDHQEINKLEMDKEIILIAEQLQYSDNYGGLIRTSEFFGVKTVIFISDFNDKLSIKMKRVSRSAEQKIDVKFENNLKDILINYKNLGFKIIALELTNKSCPIHQYKVEDKKMVLICGSEKYGISSEILEMVHDTIKIPVYGTTSSLNVVVATGIALNHLVNI